MMQQPVVLLLSVFVARGAGFENPYPYTHTNCGVTQVITDTPTRVVCMNHGATEFMLAMGLQNYIVGDGYPPDELNPIWPRYKDAYETIGFTSPAYPSAEEVGNLNADFVFASWVSAFQEEGSIWGVNWGPTVGPCDGENSDYFPAGTNASTSYDFSTCRPQLHANGIGTWLEPISCEDATLRMPPTKETLYEAITTLGFIFNVPIVAQQLIAEIKNDFLLAKTMLENSPTPSLTAVWLDGLACDGDPEKVFVGSMAGAPHLIMTESGLTNAFADRPGSWACVSVADVVAADPDVIIVGYYTGSEAEPKIDFLHNHSLLCELDAVKHADYIGVPFSASTLGPRNGAAAVDMAGAAIHVLTGDNNMNGQSGVDFFDPEVLAARTANLLCPVDPAIVKYAKTSYTNCGIRNTLDKTPERVVTMNQGSLEFMLSMGLQDRIVGTRGVPSGLDPIWPKYEEAFNNIPIMTGADGNSYPSEAEVTAANADFIFADWRSAFSEYAWNNDLMRQWSFVGECGGENSDFWPAGENQTYVDSGRAPGYELQGEIESYCRPQLHANGIGTFLSAVSCEDPTLRAPPTQQTLYDTITTMGEIFNVPVVASQLITEIQSDFVIAQQTLQAGAGHSLTAVWLDCISCCQDEPELSVFVGSGGGAPQMIMHEAGFTNLFADRENSWACVTVADIIAAEPDVMIVVEAGFDPALDKIEFMHNHTEFCNAHYVKNADYIKFPFSASTVGPRVGAAALDMVGAALKVTKKSDSAMNFNSGVGFFDPQLLVDHTKDLLCPLPADYWIDSAMTYTNCGVTNTLVKTPERVVTLHQGSTELLLAMGLHDKMVGHASMDDEIWPRYKELFDQIPMLTPSGLPTEEQIMKAQPDFIVGAYGSAFAELRCDAGENCATADSRAGIYSDATVGPCDGENSDFFPAGDPSVTAPYSTCRPQLHDNGIGTWLWVDYCEDPALRPVGGATEQTVYDAVTQLGEIFNVPDVARQLNADIRNDFAVAEAALASSGNSSLKAVWLDCMPEMDGTGGCCREGRHGWDPSKTIFVGGGHGAPNIIMEESGMINAFADRPGSWYCVSIEDIIAADPDVFVIVEASWDSAMKKIDWLHNHTDFCDMRAVQEADYIKIQFSASQLGPRNGVAALDMVNAAIHVTTGAETLNFKSGVGFFETDLLVTHTADLRCPFVPKVEEEVSPITTETEKIPFWAIALIVVFCVLFLLFFAFALAMYSREKQGKPIFKTLDSTNAAKAAQETRTAKDVELNQA